MGLETKEKITNKKRLQMPLERSQIFMLFMSSRGVCRTQSNIYDRAFLRK